MLCELLVTIVAKKKKKKKGRLSIVIKTSEGLKYLPDGRKPSSLSVFLSRH